MHTTNSSALSGTISALLIMALVVLGCGRFGRTKDGGIGDRVKNLTIAAIDPNEPFPALNTEAIDALIADVPELAKHREAALAAERDAIKGALNDMRSKSKASNRPPTGVEITPVMGERNDSRAVVQFSWPFDLTPIAMAAEIDMSSLGSVQQTIIGHQIAFFTPDEGRPDKSIGTGSRTAATMIDEKTGEIQATATVSIDTAGGTYTTEITTKVSMPVFGLDANSKVSLKGDPCPDFNGKVDLIVRSASNARAGRAGSVFYDKNIEARIVATVGDDAELAGADIDFRHAIHSSTGGREVDIITSQSAQMPGREWTKSKFSELKIIKQTGPDDGWLAKALEPAFRLADGVLESARQRWQSGGCVKIEATSPGNVQSSSTTTIPVTVRHKWDRSEVASKLDAVLSGGNSIDPKTLAKTSGTLTYTAPGETGKSATISLTANSRRGRATLDLTASTGGASYQIVGGLDDWKTNTAVCDIMKPFKLTGGGFTMEVSGGLSGTYTYTGPFNAKGTGTYTISLPNGVGKAGTMTGGGAGQITGDKVYTGTGTEKYTLTPIPPCK